MVRWHRVLAFVGLLVTVWMPMGRAEEVVLNVVRYSERKDVELPMVRSYRIPEAEMKAKVQFQRGQYRIEVSYKRMKPAVLFAGDVTCYVLWAVNRDGQSENLGELWVRPEKNDDTRRFSSGLRTFALMVTAEAYYQVSRPSDMVIFYNGPSPEPQAPSDTLVYGDFAPAPKHGLERLSSVKYDGRIPLDVLQAEKVYEIAGRLGAEDHAPDILAEADRTLRQSQQMSRSNRSRGGAQEFARKSVASSNEAIRITLREIEAEKIEEEFKRRRAEIAEMRDQISDAEARAREIEEEARQAIDRLETQKARLENEKSMLEDEKLRLEFQKARAEADIRRSRSELNRIQEERRVLEVERAALQSALETMRQREAEMQASMQQLEAGMSNLRQEKSALEGRLQSALSRVADTRDSARGLIVNLPDILFDVDVARLKPQAKMVIAKLAGILLIMQDLNLRIEGHTDSTGSAEYNQNLSEQRARSVFEFLSGEGIDTGRMKAVGYGKDRPIADNSSAQGRSKNRRVEIIISEGEVAEEVVGGGQ